ncbi:MAG: hypothetical protein GY820_01460 [Gammaproteobacteria bacterium]|nr:hypothetical protein [Gammaproteobacteria bacterium]
MLMTSERRSNAAYAWKRSVGVPVHLGIFSIFNLNFFIKFSFVIILFIHPGNKSELKIHISVTHLCYLPYACGNCTNYNAATLAKLESHQLLRHPNEPMRFNGRPDLAMMTRLKEIMRLSIGSTDWKASREEVDETRNVKNEVDRPKNRPPTRVVSDLLHNFR